MRLERSIPLYYDTQLYFCWHQLDGQAIYVRCALTSESTGKNTQHVQLERHGSAMGPDLSMSPELHGGLLYVRNWQS